MPETPQQASYHQALADFQRAAQEYTDELEQLKKTVEAHLAQTHKPK